MKCKRHTIDLTSNIGVCASCLRERLISLAASSAVSENEYSDPPPPLFFPRSVSPRKSVVGDSKPRLFATPQVGPTLGLSEKKVLDSERSFKKKKRNGISRFSNFFRTRSADSSSTFLSPSSSSSSTTKSWLSKVLSVKSKKETNCYIEDLIESENNQNRENRPRQRFCRGMSPVRDESEQRRTPAMGTTPVRKKTMMTTTKTMGYCLSPLVRAKPNNNNNNNSSNILWKGYSGELKSPANPHISTAASFCGNRSKKLVDLGRLDPRR